MAFMKLNWFFTWNCDANQP